MILHGAIEVRFGLLFATGVGSDEVSHVQRALVCVALLAAAWLCTR